MYALLVYSLKVGACLAVFYLFFKLLLSRETFHRLNRIVVLGAIVASFVLPLCVITIRRETPLPPEMPFDLLALLAASGGAETTAEGAAATAFSWNRAVVWLYVAGGAAMLGWVVWSLLSVMRVIRRGRREELPEGMHLVVLREAVTPFSWGRSVVLSEEDLAQNGEAIVCHEQAHLRLHHSVDLLVTDLAGCLQWFNPAMWLLRRELRAIHEFEADEEVLRSGVDARHYQMLLIRKAAGRRWYSVANSFNHSKLKTRITMMLRKRSSRWAAARTLLLLPLVGVALGAFAETRYVLVPDKGTKNPTKIHTARVENGPERTLLVRIDGTETADSVKQPLVLVDGKRVESLDGIAPEQIAAVTVLKDTAALANYGDEGKNGVIFVTLTKEEDPERGNVSISQVSVSGSVPGSVDPDSADSHGFITITGKPVPVTDSDSGLDGNPVIVVDGERYEGSLNDLGVQRIESMSIYKSNIPEKYRAWVGPDNEGVIEIVTRPLGETKSGYVQPLGETKSGYVQPLGETKSGYVVLPEGSLDEAQQKMSAYFNSDEWKEAQQKMSAYFNSDEWKEAQQKMSAYFNSDEWKELQQRMAEGKAYFESPEWKEKQQKLESKMADLNAYFESAEWQKFQKALESLDGDLSLSDVSLKTQSTGDGR